MNLRRHAKLIHFRITYAAAHARASWDYITEHTFYFTLRDDVGG